MDRMLYVAMNGAKQTMLAQAINTHNLANANTAAFQSDLSALLSQPVTGPGQPSRVYAGVASLGVNHAAGTINQTGRDLDVAVSGAGWIAVQAPDGTEAYTRAGNLQLTSTGQLVNGAGYPVLGNGGPIAVPPAEKIAIGSDGTISIRPLGQTANALAVVDRIKLVKADGSTLVKTEDGLMHPRQGSDLPPDSSVQLVGGALESSNVSGVEALVNMIDLARQFEMQIKLMKGAEENDKASSQILRLG